MRRALAPLLVLVVLTTGGCPAVPGDDDDPDEPVDIAEPDDETESERRTTAIEAAADARSALLEAAEDLEEAARAFEAADGREHAARAIHGLSASSTLRSGIPEPDLERPPFLPGDDDPEPQDVLNRVLGVARALGDHGAPVVSVLDDPVVGDVTGWQQEPADRNEAIADAADVASDDVVEALEGHVPRALAWTIAALRSGDEDRAAELLDRAAAHIAVAVAAIDETIRALEGEDDDAEQPVEVGPD